MKLRNRFGIMHIWNSAIYLELCYENGTYAFEPAQWSRLLWNQANYIGAQCFAFDYSEFSLSIYCFKTVIIYIRRKYGAEHIAIIWTYCIWGWYCFGVENTLGWSHCFCARQCLERKHCLLAQLTIVKFKIPDWITTCCFGSLCNALIN